MTGFEKEYNEPHTLYYEAYLKLKEDMKVGQDQETDFRKFYSSTKKVFASALDELKKSKSKSKSDKPAKK